MQPGSFLLIRVMKASFAAHVALIFGLRMDNNGTGVVQAWISVVAHPMVMRPIIVYNLAQHLIAGCVVPLLNLRERPGPI